MISMRRFLLACAGCVLLVPFAAAAQSEDQTETPPPATQSPAPQPQGEKAEEEAAEEEAAEETKRICRSVRADPSSRRKTRMCRTLEEWREMNVPL